MTGLIDRLQYMDEGIFCVKLRSIKKKTKMDAHNWNFSLYNRSIVQQWLEKMQKDADAVTMHALRTAWARMSSDPRAVSLVYQQLSIDEMSDEGMTDISCAFSFRF